MRAWYTLIAHVQDFEWKLTARVKKWHHSTWTGRGRRNKSWISLLICGKVWKLLFFCMWIMKTTVVTASDPLSSSLQRGRIQRVVAAVARITSKNMVVLGGPVLSSLAKNYLGRRETWSKYSCFPTLSSTVAPLFLLWSWLRGGEVPSKLAAMFLLTCEQKMASIRQ